MEINQIKQILKQITADVLYLTPAEISDRERLPNLGLDSIIGIELVNRLNQRFGVSLQKEILYEYPTVDRLSAYLETALSLKNGNAPDLTEKPPVGGDGFVPESADLLKRLKDRGLSAARRRELVAALEIYFGKLPGDILERFDSIAALTDYLVENSDLATARGKETAEIAVVGIGGRYPGSPNIEIFWENLRQGRDLITEIPRERWDWRRFYHPVRQTPGKSCSKWGGFIGEVDRFDPLFFQISPREAPEIDPQVRLLLETVWETLEDAGYTRKSLNGRQSEPKKVGMFIGCMYLHYPLLAREAEAECTLITQSYWSMVNRCSYFFNFKGPSMAVDTACSSSLTAVHLACESIRRGECDAAVAGGINLSLHPGKYLALNRIGLLESGAESRSLGQGDGYIPGEGVGTLLLKPLSQAEKDRDHIYGVIKGGAVNHGGNTPGFTFPSSEAQGELLREVFRKTGVNPRTISYFETSATGSPLGDQQELDGLVKTFAGFTADTGFCALGSVKPNIGHLEAASGISQLTKVLLQLKHQTLVPVIHVAEDKFQAALADSPFYIQKQAGSWERPVVATAEGNREYPRRAAINSFGAGGSNVNLILEEYIGDGRKTVENSRHIFVLSARSQTGLQKYAARMLQYLRSAAGGFSLTGTAYTLQTGREALPERLAIVCAGLRELTGALEGFIRGDAIIPQLYRGSLRDDWDDGPGCPESGNAEEELEQALAERDLTKLARLWAGGAEIAWELLYERIPVKISLPAYPFEKKRYWIEAASLTDQAAPEEYAALETAAAACSPAGCTSEAKAGTVSAAARDGETFREETVDRRGIKAALQQELRRILAEVLRIEPERITKSKRFAELGLDSILAVEFAKKLNQILGINFKVVKLYDYSNPDRLADYLIESCDPLRIAALYRRTEDLSVAAARENFDNEATPPPSPGSRRCKGAFINGIRELEEVKLENVWVGPPREHEIQIKVRAAAVNFADLLCVKGLYPTLPDYPFVLGFQVAGIVAATGRDVTSFQPGDEVVALTGPSLGGHAEYVNTAEYCAVRKASGLSFEDACGFPDAFCTAYYSLYEVGRLREGEAVLIQCAAGGVGLMAVQLAKLKQCAVYGTSGSAEKLEYLKGIGVDYVINYRTENVCQRIKELTGGRGVDLVLNSLAGDLIQQGIDSLAPGGRYLEIAVAGLRATKHLNLSAMVNNQSLHSIDLRKLWNDSPKVGQYLELMMNMAADGLITPLVFKSFAASKVGEALQYLSDRRNIGKVVLTFAAGETADGPECGKKEEERGRPGVGESDIAVISMSGRFPGAANLEKFWSNLAGGVDSITPVPAGRWDGDQFYHPDRGTPNTTYCRWGGFLEDADLFDGRFFDITPREAETIDPQQRLFLEEVWKAVELAGYAPLELAGKRCGVFVGAGPGDYAETAPGGADTLNAFTLVGSSNSILAGRISYLFNLKGPCMAIDTACSSALVAVHQACQSIRNGESELAIAGGVSVLATPALHIMAGKAEMLAGDGRCKTFDNRADGFVPGEGVGVVILKPLEKAVADHDRIYGVIKGSAVNQDGQTNGITAPGGAAQTALESGLYDAIGINPRRIGYVEAHGTGTKLGDPIEVEALANSFRKYTADRNFCALGSVKTNIGHSLAAAGIAGLIKTLLCLDRQTLVPSLHFAEPNEHIDLGASPFYVNTSCQAWESRDGKSRLAAVSSFGFGGTNVHLVLEEAPPRRPGGVQNLSRYILALSAKTAEALRRKVRDMLAWLEQNREKCSLGDISYTSTVGRAHFPLRIALAASSIPELTAQLTALLQKGIELPPRLPDPSSGDAESGRAREAAQLLAELTAPDGLSGAEYGERIAMLAKFYIRGYNPDWKLLYPQGQYRRIQLPVYPFAGERYWKKRAWLRGGTANPGGENPAAEQSRPGDAHFSLVKEECAAVSTPAACGGEEAALIRKTLEYLRTVFHEVTGITPAPPDRDSAYERTGADSLTGKAIIQCLERDFGALPATLLLEYPAPEPLGEYLRQYHRDRLIRMFGMAKPVSSGDIAIIAITGRYPGAADLDEFWENLQTGRDCVGEIPIERWDYRKYYHCGPEPATEGKIVSKWGGFIKDADRFDPLFFKIAPREAELMDPQERLFLEAAWTGLEEAGYTGNRLKRLERAVGVFAGVTTYTYHLLGAEQSSRGRAVMADSSPWTIANRVSYALDFHGPSMPVDTACSSALTAIHLACESLKRGECRMAVAGGVNLYLHPSKYQVLSQAGILSLQGRCRSFGLAGDGMVPGEGVGVMVLKPLAKAVEDGDYIYAVIKGTGINHGGASGGYSVPNGGAQTELIATTMAKAGVDPRSIGYIEAHGTGTVLGDPLEIAGLSKAFRRHTGDTRFCAIGSVKSNIGHLEAAAGIAGITKLVLQLKNRMLVPTLHCEPPNPHIVWEETPFYPQRELIPWERPRLNGAATENAPPRRGGVSSFGAGGVNAHVIVEEYCGGFPHNTGSGERRNIFLLSARNEERLKAYAQKFVAFLDAGETADRPRPKDWLREDLTFDNLAYTLQEGREAMEERLALVVSGLDELRLKLSQYCQGAGLVAGLFRGNTGTGKGDPAAVPETVDTASLLGEGKLEELAALWVTGRGEPDWKLLYGAGTPRVIPLPTYPFARERYWIDSGEGERVSDCPSGVETEQPEARSLIYLGEEWVEQELSPQNPRLLPGNGILLFDDELRLKPGLDGAGIVTIPVRPGKEFAVCEDGGYEINPAAREDYEALLEDLQRRGMMPDRIIHAWSGQAFSGAAADLEKQLQTGFYSLLFLSQALMKRIKGEKLKLLYVYTGRGMNQPVYEGLSGFAKTVGLERPDFYCNTLQIDDPGRAELGMRLAAELERMENGGGGRDIRYEAGIRRERRIVELTPGGTPRQAPELREDGVYLITGGTGGLGLIFANFIAGRVKTRLALAGRSPWDDGKRKVLAGLEASGCEVAYFEADVSRSGAVEELIGKVKAKYGGINGIIHSAGVIRDSFLLKKTAAEAGEVLAAKVYGTVWLDRATAAEPLDFFVCFSSVAALFGNTGQSDYAYGNGFLDSFTQWRRRSGRPGISMAIRWPLWREGGMRIGPEAVARMAAESGLAPLEKADGFEAFRLGLELAKSNPAVLYGDPVRIRQKLNLGGAADQVGPWESHDETRTISDAELYQKVEGFLKTNLSQVLKLPVDRIDAGRPLEQYGIDSLRITAMNRRLENGFGKLSQTLFFEYQNLAQLGRYLVEKYREQALKMIDTPGSDPGNPDNTASRQSGLSGCPGKSGENEDIAIIGLSGRYPLAETLAEFWENLQNGRDCITEIPAGRWDRRQYYDPVPGKIGKYYGEWGGFIDRVDQFDPLFFNISPREAELVDPQERLFLQTAWHLLEDAGYTREELSKAKTGVFVGVTYGHYELLGVEATLHGNPVALSSSHASIANRVSYLFNFTGPSIALDTMCSSSLTAVHFACESIRRGECRAALAGGVNLALHPSKYIQLSQGKFLSGDGRCRSFGDRGAGFVPGEGVGAMLLKPLRQAEADGDRIYAVIKGSAINHGGKTNGFTVPNPNSQTEVILDVFKKAGINPRTVNYIEAHGTGTLLGDPVEIAGLTKAFTSLTGDKGFCAIGSVKSNIGHLEAAAGIAAITKVILQMRHKKRVPSLHAAKLNPNIDFDDSPFYVQRVLEDWEPVELESGGVRHSYPRRAGISAFGAGGANAHLLLEEYDVPHSAGQPETRRQHLFLLSARNLERLMVYAGKFRRYLADNGGDLAALAYTLQVGREALEERLALVVQDRGELREKLEAYSKGNRDIPGMYTGNIKTAPAIAPAQPGDEAGRGDLQSLLGREELDQLARLWVAGAVIDWKLLYPAGTPPRIGLPLYPFADERYWVPALQEKKAETVHPEVAAATGADPDDQELMRLLSGLEQGEIELEKAKRRLGVI